MSLCYFFSTWVQVTLCMLQSSIWRYVWLRFFVWVITLIMGNRWRGLRRSKIKCEAKTWSVKFFILFYVILPSKGFWVEGNVFKERNIETNKSSVSGGIIVFEPLLSKKVLKKNILNSFWIKFGIGFWMVMYKCNTTKHFLSQVRLKMICEKEEF